MPAFNILPEIEHDPCKKVKYQREAHCQERGINKKQAYFGDRYIEAFAEVGTNAE
jgi:hypothetical protein